MRRSCWVLAMLAGACPGNASHAPSTPARALSSEFQLETVPGLSGLAVDETGALWTVAERERWAYRIRLRGGRPSLDPYVIEGVPDGMDVEGVAVLAPGRLALGAEGRFEASATVLLADVRDRRVVVTDRVDLTDLDLGLHVEPNAGTEGICGAGDTIFIAVESIGDVDGRRWAPIVRIEHGLVVRMHKLWLTTRTGKLSSLDCRWVGNRIEATAIERHFTETKILTFTIPTSDGEIAPHEALDLGPALRGKLNLEGIVSMPDGSVFVINDNQWKGVTGPSLLLMFPPRRFR